MLGAGGASDDQIHDEKRGEVILAERSVWLALLRLTGMDH